MPVRQMTVADAFYDGGKNACERAISRCIGRYQPPEALGRLLGGVVPHAGWIYSGAAAAKVYVALQRYSTPATIVLFGAVHQWGVTRPAIDAHDAWATPLGDVPVDQELAEMLLELAAGDVVRSSRAHAGEHSIEVQVPFIRKLFPEARILPMAVPPVAAALDAGRHVAGAIARLRREALVVATTDLTHYGTHYGAYQHGSLPHAMSRVKENDRRMVSLIERLDADAVLAEAQERANACGPGAVAAGVSAARQMGAREGKLLEYTTSADVMGDASADSAVGYAAMVFCAPSG